MSHSLSLSHHSNSPSSQFGLKVFMAQGHAHPFWSSSQAYEWATWPNGVPPSVVGMMEALPLSAEKGDLLVQAIYARDTVPPHTQGPGGVVCWFEDALEHIRIGIGLHRVTLFMPAKGRPRLETQIYQGSQLGWQHTPERGLAIMLLDHLRNWPEDKIKYMIGQGQELLASLGLGGVRYFSGDHTEMIVAPLDQEPLNPKGGYWPIALFYPRASEDQSPYEQAIGSAQVWATRRFLRATRRHKQLRLIQPWLKIRKKYYYSDRKYQVEWENQLLLLLALPEHPPQNVYDVRQLMGSSLRMTASDRMDPHQWTGNWFNRCEQDELTPYTPSLAGARWWLRLDSRSALHLASNMLCYEFGNLNLALVCEFLAPLGRVRINRHLARQLTRPSHSGWYLASWMLTNPKDWQDIELASFPLRNAGMFDGGFGNIDRLVKNAKNLAQSHPKAVTNLGWLIRKLVLSQNFKTQKNHIGLWNALWDDNGSIVARELALVEPHWELDTITKKIKNFDHHENFHRVRLGTIDSQGVCWPSLLGIVTCGQYSIYPVVTKGGVSVVGEYYMNCLRHPSTQNLFLEKALINKSRLFIIEDGTSDSALTQINYDDVSKKWVVDQCLGWANQPPPHQVVSLAHRLALVYTALTNHQALSQDEINTILLSLTNFSTNCQVKLSL